MPATSTAPSEHQHPECGVSAEVNCHSFLTTGVGGPDLRAIHRAGQPIWCNCQSFVGALRSSHQPHTHVRELNVFLRLVDHQSSSRGPRYNSTHGPHTAAPVDSTTTLRAVRALQPLTTTLRAIDCHCVILTCAAHSCTATLQPTHHRSATTTWPVQHSSMAV